MQLDADEFQAQDEKEERSLPIDTGLADAASNPAMDADIEQRSERPDDFAIGARMAQHASQCSRQNIHGQGKPLAENYRRQSNQHAPRDSRQASADHAHQDRALEGNVGRVEIVHPVAHQYAQGNGRAHDEDNLDLLAQGAFLAEQQNAKTARPHQYAADGRGDAEADQHGNEYEAMVHSVASGYWVE